MAEPDIETLSRLLPPGAAVRVVHGKPWRKTVTMRCTVQGWCDGLLVLERTFSAGGTYDSLGAPKLAGDYGTTEVQPGGRVLRRTYYRADGRLIGELFNIQTPTELRSGEVAYTDLEVDVVRFADGRVQVVDEEDLERAVRAGGISRALADQALAIASHLAELLRTGGDWRMAG